MLASPQNENTIDFIIGVAHNACVPHTTRACHTLYRTTHVDLSKGIAAAFSIFKFVSRQPAAALQVYPAQKRDLGVNLIRKNYSELCYKKIVFLEVEEPGSSTSKNAKLPKKESEYFFSSSD